MKRVAAEIRSRLEEGLRLQDAVSNESDPLVIEAAQEGGLRAVVSYRRERDSKLREAKLKLVCAEGRPLACEVCTFDFAKTYGDRGRGYIEVHHVTPLHVSGVVQTRLEDLVLLCSNCHRMIHRSGWLRPEELKEMVQE
ncbi:HNH endonuclease [Brevibacterium epidermidis]|uniref:HNH endonuclease n=1 Tax=Brevibacterium epidermidis TaxID=1698 RepID=UPI003BAFA3E2